VPCYHPIRAYYARKGNASGRRSLVFDVSGAGSVGMPIPCGRCIGCRLERSRQCAVRLMHECSVHADSSFVTLTYADEFLPPHGSLPPPPRRDLQLFFKRLRKFFGGERISYFAVGEYGDSTWRPHYHACLFGVWFPDQVERKAGSGGAPLYQSPTLDRLWGLGECLVGGVSFESAAYVARYSVKKVNGEKAPAHYERVDSETGEVFYLEPEFMLCSTRPGIGRRWYERFGSEVRAADAVVARGFESKPPRYYDKLMEASYPKAFAVAKAARIEAGASDDAWKDQRPARLAVREAVKKAQYQSLKRNLE